MRRNGTALSNWTSSKSPARKAGLFTPTHGSPVASFLSDIPLLLENSSEGCHDFRIIKNAVRLEHQLLVISPGRIRIGGRVR